MSAAACQRWAQHLVPSLALGGHSGGATDHAVLTAAEAARVQRHCDHIMAALRRKDRSALIQAKEAVLDEAFRSGPAQGGDNTSVAGSPALRRTLRDLSWHMAGWLLPISRQ